MAAKETLLHTIKVNRQLRKLNKKVDKALSCVHPAFLDGWDDLSSSDKSIKLARWKILVKKNYPTS